MRPRLTDATGKVPKALLAEYRPPVWDEPDERDFERNLVAVLNEIQRERLAGSLAPFVEGTQVGCYGEKPDDWPADKPWLRAGHPQHTTHYTQEEYETKRREWQQKELRALRAKNDADIHALRCSRRYR